MRNKIVLEEAEIFISLRKADDLNLKESNAFFTIFFGLSSEYSNGGNWILLFVFFSFRRLDFVNSQF